MIRNITPDISSFYWIIIILVTTLRVVYMIN